MVKPACRLVAVTEVADAQAPRFEAYLGRFLGQPMFVMRRRDWESLQIHEGRLVEIDVRRTPMGGVVANAPVIGTVAERVAPTRVQVAIYRVDEQDKPRLINVDTYLVYERFPDQWDYRRIVNAASTEYNENLRAYLREHVFIVKEKPGEDHWLEELPATVKAVFRRS